MKEILTAVVIIVLSLAVAFPPFYFLGSLFWSRGPWGPFVCGLTWAAIVAVIVASGISRGILRSIQWVSLMYSWKRVLWFERLKDIAAWTIAVVVVGSILVGVFCTFKNHPISTDLRILGPALLTVVGILLVIVASVWAFRRIAKRN